MSHNNFVSVVLVSIGVMLGGCLHTVVETEEEEPFEVREARTVSKSIILAIDKAKTSVINKDSTQILIRYLDFKSPYTSFEAQTYYNNIPVAAKSAIRHIKSMRPDNLPKFLSLLCDFERANYTGTDVNTAAAIEERKRNAIKARELLDESCT